MSENGIVEHKQSGLAPLSFNREQVDLIKRTVAVGATDDELKLFLYTAKKSGLDPLARQIYAIKRKGKMTIQTGIDGYRLIADRTKLCAGNEDPVYDNDANPKKATVTVYKIVGGVRCPFTASARWDQYYPGDAQGFMWKKMPHLMLGKCAEGLALRKAFPAELSGIYTEDEMSQSGPSQPVHHETKLQEPRRVKPVEAVVEESSAPVSNGSFISDKQRKRFFAMWKSGSRTEEEVKAYLKEHFNTESTSEIPKGAGYNKICEWVEAKSEPVEEAEVYDADEEIPFA